MFCSLLSLYSLRCNLQAMIGSECVGAIVCKLDLNRKSAKRGYIAMLAVDGNHRNKGIGMCTCLLYFSTCKHIYLRSLSQLI